MLFRLVVVVLAGSSIVLAEVTPQQVRAAIDRGKEWLYRTQNADGNWESKPAPDPNDKPWNEGGGQWGGLTALITNSLLCAGERASEPRLARAIEFLRGRDLTGVYALSMRCQVFARLPPTPENRQILRQDAMKLLSMMRTTGRSRGFWDYVPGEGGGYSHSRGNYAVLGLWAAASEGVEIPDAAWKTIAEAWIRHQDPSGGWTYKAREDTEYALTPGMTAAGVATLYIAQDYIFPEGAGRSAPLREAIDRGTAWLAANFDKVTPAARYDRDFPYPTIYAVERVGLAGGLRYIGQHDWYARITRWLLDNQRPGGGWHRDGRGSGSPSDTAFALITLSRGIAPIAISKLDYLPADSKAADWNLRPRDAANVVRFMGKAIEQELNWQVVTIDSPVRDWHESPILYLEGGKPLALDQAGKEKLRQYVEQGGLILFAADASSRAFSDSVRALGLELFPDSEWRELPQQHPIYTDQQFPRSGWKTKPVVLGLSNGVRERMILLPSGDPPRWWQANNPSAKQEFWELAANLHQYAAGRENLRSRGESHLIVADESVQPQRTVRLARLQYPGNWDPEPGGWRRVAAAMRNRDRIHLEVTPVKLGEEIPKATQIAHLTGTDALKLEPVAITALRVFVDTGGTLLIDCAGGASAFASAVEPVFRELFIEVKPQPLPLDHPMLAGRDGKPLRIEYRPFARRTLGELRNESRLQCLMIKGRPAVIFSREDLSAGLVGNNVDGILGYSPATALEMVCGLVRSVK
ncbi:MAG: DUF4159 domain-containing protein [Phycisphaerales bacterium]|nr:DUF4159 domain-containing protein [Phycisphaerales bacterium]